MILYMHDYSGGNCRIGNILFMARKPCAKPLHGAFSEVVNAMQDLPEMHMADGCSTRFPNACHGR